MDSSVPRPVGDPFDPDADPLETAEWVEALESLIAAEGPERATYLLRRLLQHARARRVPLPQVLATPYVNTVGLDEQPPYEGNLEIEARISALVRWNALAMVVRANRESAELGGHIASYASAADLFEVGFNHFFRAGRTGISSTSSRTPRRACTRAPSSRGALPRRTSTTTGARPAARALVLLPSVAHARLLAVPHGLHGPRPALRDLPGAIHALPRASRARRHATRKVWAFVGDGEMDEPEALAGLSIAAREKLDNLVIVVNCNLQRSTARCAATPRSCRSWRACSRAPAGT
jgi:pyruvate dehydrogenase E1 component